jgi:hypothetical protein
MLKLFKDFDDKFPVEVIEDKLFNIFYRKGGI